MVKIRISRFPEGNESNNLTGLHKGEASNTNRYQDNKTQTNTQGPELEAEIKFNSWCSNLEGRIFNIDPRASYNFSRTINYLEEYLGSTYSDRCQPSIMTKTWATFPDPETPTIIPDTSAERLKTNG